MFVMITEPFHDCTLFIGFFFKIYIRVQWYIRDFALFGAENSSYLRLDKTTRNEINFIEIYGLLALSKYQT